MIETAIETITDKENKRNMYSAERADEEVADIVGNAWRDGTLSADDAYE